MINKCCICDHSLNKQSIPFNYKVEGWEHNKTIPATFDYYSCDNCFKSEENNHFSVCYLGDEIWTIGIENPPELHIYNNYIANRCVISAYHSNVLVAEKIYIAHTINLDLADLKKIKELVKTYVIFT